LTFSPRALALALLTPLAFAACLPTDSTSQDGNGFYLNVPTANLTVQAGSSTETVLGIARSGTFVGPIYLSASGAATGITVKFDPDTIPPGVNTSNMTIAADSTAASGGSTFALLAKGDPNFSLVTNIPVLTMGISGIRATAIVK
jgi:hypothetical protein